MCEASSKANENLLRLVRDTPKSDGLDLSPLVNTVTSELGQSHVPTRVASLRWISTLLERTPEEMATFIDELFPALLRTLSDESDHVVVLDLEVLVRIANGGDVSMTF